MLFIHWLVREAEDGLFCGGVSWVKLQVVAKLKAGTVVIFACKEIDCDGTAMI